MNKSILNFIKEDFQYYTFLLAAFLLPLWEEYIPILMFLWVLSSVLGIGRFRMNYCKAMVLLVFPFVIYFLYAIGVLYSDNIKSGLFDLEVKLSILLIPMVAITASKNIKINYRLILKLFIIGNIVASLFCLFFAFKNSFYVNQVGYLVFDTSHWPTLTQHLNFFQIVNGGYSNFSYTYLSKIHHPTYFSMYITMSIIILLDFLRFSKKKLWNVILIIYFILFLWLLGSRAAYLTLIFIFIVFALSRLLKVKRKWIVAVVIVLGLFSSNYVILNSRLGKNIEEVYEILTTDKKLTKDSDIRLRLWKSGFEIFKDNIWFGVGTGDLVKEMDIKYKQYDLELEREYIYNPHNQYLTIAITLGLVGVIVFISWIITTLFITIKSKQFLLLYFMLIVAINMFFESILNLIAGVSFFAFFYSLLCAMYFSEINKGNPTAESQTID